MDETHLDDVPFWRSKMCCRFLRHNNEIHHLLFLLHWTNKWK